MYEYDEYFDVDLRTKPYSSSGEELEDYLKIIDMILENLLERRGIKSEEKLFSKGLVITESELKAYYTVPPVVRKLDLCDPMLSASVREAFDYIDERIEHTGRTLSYLKIESLKRNFELDRAELIALLLSLIGMTDRRYERIFGFLQDDITCNKPTTGLLLTAMRRINTSFDSEDDVYNVISDKMRECFFKPSDEKGLRFPLVLNETILKFILEDDDSFEATKEVYEYEEDNDIPLFFDEESKGLTALCWSSDEGHYYIENEDPETVEHILFHHASGTMKRLIIVNISELDKADKKEKERILNSLKIRVKLGNIILGVRCPSETKTGNETELEIPLEKDTKDRLIEKINKNFSLDRVFFYGSKDEPYKLSKMSIPAIEIEFPSVEKRVHMWEYFSNNDEKIKLSEDIDVPDFADCHVMSYGKIKSICTYAVSLARLNGSNVITRKMILDAILKLNNVNFSSLANRIEAQYTWEDITIADDQADILHVACDRYKVRNRVAEKWGLRKKNAYGNGVSILLYGPPGTGKTMAAQVIANELSLPLYRIDISRIFSKYIGETEKNLSVIFDAAKGANVILFFDEADALFSKRTEIKDSNDKYSNSETAFLLQKIEEYDGMSILATNYYQNFDNAFIRRLTYAAHLDSPDEEQRYLLWTTILPKETELNDDIDFRHLAQQFELSGSNIKSILYSAAYMAGANKEALGMRHIAKAMQYEYKKLGKLASRSDFGMLMAYL